MASHGSTKHVIFLNRFFYPDHAPTSELLSELAFELARRGFRVTVITSRLHYEVAAAVLPPHERVNGVDIWRVWTSKQGRQQLLGRSLDYLTFYLAAAWRVWRCTRAGDIVIAKTDPPLLSVVAAPIAWLRGAHLINWLQDIFPEVAEALNVGGRFGRAAFRLMRPVRNWSLRSARSNVVVGEGMARHLRALGIAREKLCVIPNWADGIRITPVAAKQNWLRKLWTPKSRFIVEYAGNLGRAHDVETVIAAMTLLQERAKDSADISAHIMFVFIGAGALRAQLAREVIKRKLRNVRMYPYQPREQLAETLGVADAHIVTLNPQLEGLIVPSKFYSIAAAGRPTLFIGSADGEIASLIYAANCGFSVPPGGGEELARRILQLAQDHDLCTRMGTAARKTFEQYWGKDRAVAKWENLLRAANGKAEEVVIAEASGPSAGQMANPAPKTLGPQ